MSHIKIATNLQLEKIELERFIQFLDKDGFRLYMNSLQSSWGLLKLSDDSIPNGKVTEGLLDSTGQKTVRVSTILGLSKDSQWIRSEEIKTLNIPPDNKWYWVGVRYQSHNLERGTFSIDREGNLVGSGSELLKILRSNNFSSNVKLVGSSYNKQEYEVIDVINDTNAILAGDFVPESNLKLSIVGTFTPGAFVLPENKYPFNYDGCEFLVLPETQLNTKPTSLDTIFLSRVKSYNQSIVIQDKRTQFFTLNGLPSSCYAISNPLVGVESVKYSSTLTPGSENIVQLGWGLRTSNYSIVPTTNTLTLNSGLGGKYKDLLSFTNGEINGWKVYTSDGLSSKVISSTKTGSSINLVLDILNVDSYFAPASDSLIEQVITIVPPVENIEFQFLSDDPNSPGAMEEEIYSFSSSLSTGRVVVPVLRKVEYSYRVNYRYTMGSLVSPWFLLPSDNTKGYLTEDSFDSNGNLLPIDRQIRRTYTSSNLLGFITLKQSPNSFQSFKQRVDRDKPGVEYPSFKSNESMITLTPGLNTTDQVLRGGVLSTYFPVLFINLTTLDVEKGSTFIIHLSSSLTLLQSTAVHIVQDFVNTANFGTILKSITVSDIAVAKNSDSSCFIRFVFDEAWTVCQSYEAPKINEGCFYIGPNLERDFDITSGLGKVKGWFGWTICNGQNGSPDLRGRYVIGYSGTSTSNLTLNQIGSILGSNEGRLTKENLPAHSHELNYHQGSVGSNIGNGEAAVKWIQSPGEANTNTTKNTGPGEGLGRPFDNRPESIVLPYVMRIY